MVFVTVTAGFVTVTVAVAGGRVAPVTVRKHAELYVSMYTTSKEAKIRTAASGKLCSSSLVSALGSVGGRARMIGQLG